MIAMDTSKYVIVIVAILTIFSINIIDVTLACSGTNVLQCLKPLEALTQEHYADPNVICNELKTTIDCFEREVAKCPGPEEHLDWIRNEFKQWQAMCDSRKKEEGSPGENQPTEALCTSEDLMSCVKPLDHLQMGDLKMACLTMHNVVECIHKEIDTCPKYLDSYVAEIKEQLKLPLTMCDPYFQPLTLPPAQPSVHTDQSAVTKTDPPCDWITVRSCLWPVDQLMREFGHLHLDPIFLCHEHWKAMQCLEEKSSTHCPTDVASRMVPGQILMDQLSLHCDRYSNAGSSDTSVQVVPHSSKHKSDCVEDYEMEKCLIHNQMGRPDSVDSNRKEHPLSRKQICIMVGHSDYCVLYLTRHKPSCSTNLDKRMAAQMQDLKSQCKRLGYPTSNTEVTLPCTLIITTMAAMTVVLRHFL